MKELTARVAIDKIRRQRKELDAVKAELSLTIKQRDGAQNAFMEELSERQTVSKELALTTKLRDAVFKELNKERNKREALKAELALTIEQRDNTYTVLQEVKSERKTLKEILGVVSSHKELLLDELDIKDKGIERLRDTCKGLRGEVSNLKHKNRHMHTSNSHLRDK